MPAALFASPFARLDLSLEEREYLRTTANTLVSETMTLYESYMWDDHSTIDAGKWAHKRTREDVSVYHDRRPGAGTDNKDMHLLLTVGTVLGNLNDAMYGVLNHTTDAMRIKTAYVQDTLLDSAVLETIAEPTVDDPFQSTTVRWFVKGVPLHVRLMSKHRDNVYLEATGMKHLRNGEAVGFHLMHSISFTKTPRLPQFDRFNMSICTIWRQQSPQRVEAFMTSYIEIEESFLVPMIVKSTADALVSLWKVIECGQMKKLGHLVGRKNAFTDPDGDAHAPIDGCSMCGSHARSARRGAKSACAICTRTICKKCYVKREMAYFTPDRNLLKPAMRFCLPCLTASHKIDAAAIAVSEAAEMRTRAGSQKSHKTTSSYDPRVDSGAYGAPTVSSSFSEKSY